MSWALNDAPLPPDERGQPSRSSCAFVLVALANFAGKDGTGAFPSVETITHYTHLSERSVRRCLDRLQECGAITPSDPALVAAKIKRPDRRPQSWDLALARHRDDQPDGVQSVHPATSDGVSPLHPVDRKSVV